MPTPLPYPTLKDYGFSDTTLIQATGVMQSATDVVQYPKSFEEGISSLVFGGLVGEEVPITGALSLGDGTTSSGTIRLNLADNKGDTYIASGKIDFLTTGASGFILGVDDSDSNRTKFYLGDTINYLYWDGTNLVISGATLSGGTIGSIDIGGADTTSFHVDSDGNMWLGAAAFAGAPFKVSNAGVATITTGTITGITDLAIADGGTGASTAVNAFNALSPLTTQGDTLYNDGTNDVRLAKDASATRYMSNTGASNNPAWAQVALTTGVSGVLPTVNGGTNVVTLFDHFATVGNVGLGEDDLYSDTIAAGQLAGDGEKLECKYGGTFVGHATATRQIRLRFAGTTIFDTGALAITANSSWTLSGMLIRVSASVVRYMFSLTTQSATLSAYTSVGELTGLTLANTNILQLTGEAAGVGAATDDVKSILSTISWVENA